MKRPLLTLFFIMTTAYSYEAQNQETIQAVDRLLKSREYDAAVRILKTSIEESGDLWARSKLAETYILAKRGDDALGELDQIQMELARKEREAGALSEKEIELLKLSNNRIDQIVRGTTELQEIDRKTVRTYAEFGRRMVSQKDYRSAELALKQIEKLEPGGEEALKLKGLLEGASSVEGWKDLTSFRINAKEHHEDAFGINRVPVYAQSSFQELQKKGFNKCIFLHPRDMGLGFVEFSLPFPIGTFKASVGITSSSVGNASFKVLVHDLKVYESGPLKSGDPPKTVLVSFPPSKRIKLVTDSNGSNSADHCIWLDPLVK
jgi:hypothetical protein